MSEWSLPTPHHSAISPATHKARASAIQHRELAESFHHRPVYAIPVGPGKSRPTRSIACRANRRMCFCLNGDSRNRRSAASSQTAVSGWQSLTKRSTAIVVFSRCALIIGSRIPWSSSPSRTCAR